jgi:uncharacterized membrane protein HdeD (DUF308 family)
MSDWLKWMLLGILSIVFGVFALNHAVLTSISVTLVVGALLIVAGIAQVIAGFGESGTGSRLLTVLLGAVLALLGISFLANPLAGTISLAILTTIFIGAGGALRLIFAMQIRGTPYFWLMLVSGVLSIGLAVFILANPGVKLALLGILLGIELIFNGAGLIALGLYRRRQGRGEPPAGSPA